MAKAEGERRTAVGGTQRWCVRAQRIVTAYEAKQAEVLRESAGLRAALDHLQQEHRALANQQARPPAMTRAKAPVSQPLRNTTMIGVVSQCQACIPVA